MDWEKKWKKCSKGFSDKGYEGRRDITRQNEKVEHYFYRRNTGLVMRIKYLVSKFPDYHFILPRNFYIKKFKKQLQNYSTTNYLLLLIFIH